MKLIYPSQSVASALRSPASGWLYVRDACDRQYIWRPPWPPRDIVIHHHFRVHPVRPVDKGVPSFPATCEFDHSRLDREKAHDPCSPPPYTPSCLEFGSITTLQADIVRGKIFFKIYAFIYAWKFCFNLKFCKVLDRRCCNYYKFWIKFSICRCYRMERINKLIRILSSRNRIGLLYYRIIYEN